MRYTIIPSLFAFVVLVLAVNIEAKDVNTVSRRHHAKIARTVQERNVLAKRSFSGSATWYSFGKGDLGACGQGLDPNDYVVALNEGQYGNLDSQSSHCGKTITISNGVKSTQARIMDACPMGVQCHWGALDMSQSLFTFFNPLGVGVFDITWWFGGGDDGGDSGTSQKTKVNSQKSDDDNKNNNDDDEEAKKEAAKKKAAKEKAKEEEKKKEAEKEKAKKEKEKEKEEKAKKEKAKKEKAKKEKEAKIEQAQEENVASFGEIMEALNSMVTDALE